MMEFNFLVKEGDRSDRRAVHIDYGKMPAGIAKLARSCSNRRQPAIAHAPNPGSAYDRMPAALTRSLAVASKVPIDIDPIFSFDEPVDKRSDPLV